MEIIYEISGDILVADLFGELDHHEAEKTRRDIDDMAANYGARHLVLDFSRVTFMDSAGIGVVLGRYKKMKAAGGQVILAGCSPKVESILAMAGIFSIMQAADTKEHAITYLQGKEVS